MILTGNVKKPRKKRAKRKTSKEIVSEIDVLLEKEMQDVVE